MTEHDPLDFAGQERAAADNAEEERRRRQEEISDLCKVMGSKEGRRFMWRLLSDAGVFRSTFDPNAGQMSFNEGYRNAGLKQMTDILEACPQQYALMLDEQRKAKERDEQRNADRRNRTSARH